MPPVLALLPEYAGREDPVADLRAAAQAAVAWLLDDPAGGPVRVLAADAQAERIGAHLLGASAPDPARGGPRAGDPALVLVNGSSKRSERAPGHLDERAHAFDEVLGAALAAGDTAALAGLDRALATQLGTSGLDVLASLRELSVDEVVVDYADDPYGVSYWVVRWTCAS